MFDPTIYENIKVVIQGAVYDLDLRGLILVTNRADIVDLAHMSRTFKIKFKDAEQRGNIFAEIVLKANLKDFATEILERYDEPKPGCRLEINFEQSEQTEDQDIVQIHKQLVHLWGSRPLIQHEINGQWSPESTPNEDLVSTFRGSKTFTTTHRVTLDFNRTIDENQIEDIPKLLELMLKSLELMDGKVINRRV